MNPTTPPLSLVARRESGTWNLSADLWRGNVRVCFDMSADNLDELFDKLKERAEYALQKSGVSDE